MARKSIFYKKFKVLLIVVSLITSFMFTLPVFSSSSTFIDTFESSKIDEVWSPELAASYSGTVVKLSSGSYVFRAELHKTDPDVNGNKRAELALGLEKPNEEHWYSVDILLPSDKDEKYIDDPSREIILQWHNWPDKGEEWTSPPLALETENGHYYIHSLWDDEEITSNDQMYEKGNFRKYDLGPVSGDIGKWVNWTFHVKWGWLESHNPILEVYKDSKKVLDLNGLPNTTNDKWGVYMKVGIYKWEWKMPTKKSSTTKRVVYYDNIQIDNIKEDVKLAMVSQPFNNAQ